MRKNFILLILFLVMLSSLYGYSFGQNKIQRSNLKWAMIETLHFDIYFNEGDEEFGKIVALMAEEAYYYLKDNFKTPVFRRIPIIFYKSHQDFETTNVIFPLLNEAVGGFTESGKNRVALPFHGSFKDLEETFIHELTHAYVNDLNRSRNRFLNITGLPFWFTEGLPEFLSIGGKSPYNNMFIIDLLINDGMPNINDVGGYYAYRLGESLLTYIGEKYGRDLVMEYFYALRISASLETATQKIFGLGFEELQLHWKNYLKRRYFKYMDDYNVPYEVFERVTDHHKDGSSYNFAPRFTPDGNHFLYFSNKNIKSDIWYGQTLGLVPNRKLINGESTGKFEEFHFQRNNFSWMPDGKSFLFVSKTAKGDKIYLADFESGNILDSYEMFQFDAIFEIDVSNDGTKIVFSGQKNLKNDLYIMDLNTQKITQITNDYYNDHQPRWSPDTRKILFTSERIIDENYENKHLFYELNKDIYYYDLEDSLFYQVTFDDYNNEFPIWDSSGTKVLFVSEGEFASSFQIIDLVNGQKARVTNSLGGVFTGDLSSDDKNLIFSCFYNGGWDIYIKSDPLLDLNYSQYNEPRVFEFKADFFERFKIENYKFFGRRDLDFKKSRTENYNKNYTKLDLRGEPSVDSLNNIYNRRIDQKPTNIKVPQIKPYRVRFSLDRLWGGMAYSPSGGTYAQIQLGLSDLMGNHAIGINVGISGELDNSNFVFNYLYLAHRIDYGIGGFYLNDEIVYLIQYYNDDDYDYMRQREREYGLYGILRYPFNKFWRVDLENVVFKNELRRDWLEDPSGNWQENYNELGLPDYEYEIVYTPQLSFVHDNTIYGSVGPISGWRGAIIMNRNFSNQDSYSIFFADLRKYFFFEKRYAFAMRGLGGAILGTSNQYFNFTYFNGVRGFDDEDLEGEKKFLTSMELRFPFLDNIKIAFPLPLFLYNIRGSIFADAGAIWDENKTLRLIKDGRLKDLKAGFGFGPRMNLGYFVLKFDIAWNTDLERFSKPIYYVTLSPDF